MKLALFAFRGDMLCFVHVLINALDADERGGEARIIFEGEAVKLVGELAKEGAQFHNLYAQCKEKGLIAGACKACSAKLGATEAVRAEGLPLLEGAKGHPSMAAWRADGFEIVTF
jgi:hypothetical protein